METSQSEIKITNIINSVLIVVLMLVAATDPREGMQTGCTLRPFKYVFYI